MLSDQVLCSRVKFYALAYFYALGWFVHTKFYALANFYALGLSYMLADEVLCSRKQSEQTFMLSD